MKKRVLFVCLGNICRSPAAEAIFAHKLAGRGMDDIIEADSAGTGGWHVGRPADSRMREHANKRGYRITSLARKFNPEKDFDHFDLIVAMDDENLRTLRSMARDKNDISKIRKMTDFSREFSYSSVPDPYYGGEDGFELVLDLLEDAVEGLYEEFALK